jgi:IS30 family transposase
MGKRYAQLSLQERIEIYRLHADGKSRRAIAGALGRSVATISRELRRNSKTTRIWRGGYDPQRAHILTRRRHARGRAHKLERLPELRQLVLDRLQQGWSPEQIAGRLAREQPHSCISYESIYRYIYWRSWSFNGTLHRLLPRHKYRRRRRRENRRWCKAAIFQRASIHDRPARVARRTHPAHWEADLMGFSKQGQYLLVAHERKSRWTVLRRQNTKSAQSVVDNLGRVLGSLPPSSCRSITFDNGSEFSKHYLLRRHHNIQTWFCDTHSPWQKGGIENAIGRLRRMLPRKTNLDTISGRTLNRFRDRYNNTPRKCLGFKTPNEVFLQDSVALQT